MEFVLLWIVHRLISFIPRWALLGHRFASKATRQIICKHCPPLPLKCHAFAHLCPPFVPLAPLTAQFGVNFAIADKIRSKICLNNPKAIAKNQGQPIKRPIGGEPINAMPFGLFSPVHLNLVLDTHCQSAFRAEFGFSGTNKTKTLS